jgi:pilus assembly protein Flp/PilA
MIEKTRRLLDDETGATMVEYALLLGLISVAAISVLTLISPELKARFQSVLDQL